jgi:hypothetical protein
MNGRRPSRFVLFALEIPRLFLVLVAVSGAGGGIPASRAAALASPHALFVLLALFSWFDPDKYDAYRPLFSVGKLISAVALGVWLGGAVPGAMNTARLNDARELFSLVAVVAVAAYDTVSGIVVGISALRSRAAEEKVQDLPALVVDELPDDVGGS